MPACPECKSSKLHKFGLKWSCNPDGARTKKQQYICNSCGRITVNPTPEPARNTKGRFLSQDSNITTIDVSHPVAKTSAILVDDEPISKRIYQTFHPVPKPTRR